MRRREVSKEKRWEMRFIDGVRYEIVNPAGAVEDTVSVKELATTEHPQQLMIERLRRAQGVYRVRRFARKLRDGQ